MQFAHVSARILAKFSFCAGAAYSLQFLRRGRGGIGIHNDFGSRRTSRVAAPEISIRVRIPSPAKNLNFLRLLVHQPLPFGCFDCSSGARTVI